ncbi:MAG: hypothetical protein CVT63_00045 [Candidatus Anoxymicrobium japonicum]|uniref:Uncharacterized protein n=1 Tax=Candidatus Anoxymicrobium japonicum TaxID=2013648 RepID=A0A2N3G8D3_9ACTN|nr:MAG: hypothetical protein CVT63_00045 [Candidatus Anoxymicrobium japonicum]
MSDFKVHGKGIDTAALEAELAERVEARRLSGACSRDVEALLAERLPDEEGYGALPPIAELDYAAKRALSSWEVSAAYPVQTEKGRLIRPFIIFAKRLARLWARIAVGPIQREQTTFNRHAAAALEAVRAQAVAERAEAHAAEEDLSELAGALLTEGEADASSSAIAEYFKGTHRATIVGPCPSALSKALADAGFKVLRVSEGTAWDVAPAGTQTSTTAAPISFLAQLDEGSQEALVVSELSFWLRPEALISLARRSYLTLMPRGKMAVTVHGFASGGPAPAWCAAPVVKKALSMAGFIDISVVRPGDSGGRVVVARKP